MIPNAEKLLARDEFSLWCPGACEIIEKAGSKVDVEETRPIGGYCSTEDLDRQDEVVVAKGLDFSEFVAFGYFNDNHKQDTTAVLGYPRLARLEGNRWWTEGNLIRGFGPADKLWDLAKAMQGTPRRLGFSIEGKVLERSSGNRIVRAKVRNVAITSQPVNTACSWGVLAKAFAPEAEVERAHQKALSAGHATVPLSSGGPLIDEDLEGYVRPDQFSYDEAVQRIQKLRPHLSKAACRRIVRFAMCR